MASSKQYAQALYTLAHTDIETSPFHNHQRTLRLISFSNLQVSEVAVLFSNICGKNDIAVGMANIAKCDENGVLTPGTLRPLTVQGVQDFTLTPGSEIYSDRVNFTLNPGDYYAVNIYYPTDAPVYSGNWLGHLSRRSRVGNYTADAELDGPIITKRLARTLMETDMTTPVTTVRRIIGYNNKPSLVLGCFGDSITQQSNWTVPLAKLLYNKYPGQISLCNLGISGNRLLRSSPAGHAFGEAGIGRFERDLLTLDGLTHAIIELGTNDIGQPGATDIHENEVPTLETYIRAMEGLAARLHEKKVKVYAATLCPRAIEKPYTLEREALRNAMNDWLRHAACFDAVLDFDAVLRHSDGTPGMRDGFALPDGLHPTYLGGLHIAKSIDLTLFENEGGNIDA